MNWRTTGILFVLLLIVGGLVFWQSRQAEEGADATPTVPAVPTEAASLFSDTAAEDVTRLDLQRTDDVGARFASFAVDGSGWWQTVPTATQVMSQTVTNRLRTLLTASPRRTLPAGANPLSAYGLDDPAGEITIASTQDGQTVRHTLHVGNETPAGDGYYVQKQGDPRVYIVTKLTIDNLLNFIDDPPLPAPTPTITVPITGTLTPTPAE